MIWGIQIVNAYDDIRGIVRLYVPWNLNEVTPSWAKKSLTTERYDSLESVELAIQDLRIVDEILSR